MLKRAFMAGAMSAGIKILNLLAVPTPVLQFAIKRFGIDGGAMFSSAHNTKENVVFKIYEPAGIEFRAKKIEDLYNNYLNSKIIRVGPKKIGSISSAENVMDVYQAAITQFIDINLISDAKLIIVADCADGPLGKVLTPIINNLKIDSILLNTQEPDLDQILPNLNSIRRVSKIIRTSEANLGICFDTDGSKALFLDENGNFIESDDLLTLFISELIESPSSQKKVIATESTTKIIDEMLKKVSGSVTRVENKPGSVSSLLKFGRYDFGASDSGKYRFPEYAPFSDTVLTTLKILELVVKKNLKISELIQRVPKSIKIYKELSVEREILEKFPLKISQNLEENVENYKLIYTLIGIKIFLGVDKGWININPHLDQNLLLLSAESKDKKYIQEIFGILEDIILGN
jgi:phosphomannomutase